MWDKKSSRPAIFLEKTYPISRTSTEFQKQFEKHAIEQGKRLGVSVFIAPSEDSPKKSCHTLASLGGQAPYEYSDATRRLTDGGKYEHEAFCIYDGHPPALAN